MYSAEFWEIEWFWAVKIAAFSLIMMNLTLFMKNFYFESKITWKFGFIPSNKTVVFTLGASGLTMDLRMWP